MTSTEVIDNIGVNGFNSWVLKTRVIIPKVNSMDKYPIWDGELLVYNNENTNAENLSVRVPVQIKSEIKKKELEDKEKYSVKIAHLKKYMEEGGVLFIKAICDIDNDETKFFGSLLMKADIIEIIGNNTKQKNKTIYLEELKEPIEILKMCKNFKLHRVYQMQLPNTLSNEVLNSKIDIYSFGYINDVHELITKKQYGYAKLDGDILAYIGKIKTDALYGRRNVNIDTEKKKYYNHVTEIITEQRYYFKINDYVRIEDEKIIIDTMIKKELTLDSTIECLEFALDLYENRNIIVGKVKVNNLKFNESQEYIEERIKSIKNNLNYFYSAKETFDKLNIPTKDISIADIIKYENNICKIRDVIYEKIPMRFENINSDRFTDVNDIFGNKFLIYFIKQPDGSYLGYDYLKSDELNDAFKYGAIKLSRYFNLKAEVLSGLNYDELVLLKELKESENNEIIASLISNFMMEMIKAYDLTGNKKFLNHSQEINKILRKRREYYNEESYKINKLQIEKRKTKELTIEQINKINLMKVKSKENLTKACCCLLLDNYSEFIILFNELDDDEKEQFKKWAIFNLLPQEFYKDLNE